MPLSIGKVSVDVSLCGSVPRSWSSSLAESAPPTTVQCPKTLSEITSSDLSTVRDSVSSFLCAATINGNKLSTQPNRSKNGSTSIFSGESLFSITNSFDTLPTSEMTSTSRRDSMLLPMIEPPQWAVPARGDARLKPVCEALGSHPVVDLTSKPCFRVGRSPGSDVQLLHNTSSRRHALLFHHPNGGCYVVDCGSSHGTFINGVRVRSTPSGSMVIPQRVRRGSLVRFGGPGAPSFVLKSFSIGFSSMMKDVSPIEEAAPDSEAIAIHARLNSLGPQEGGILKKRSFEETSDAPDAKRQRCVSPASTMLESGPIRLVSPDSPRKSKRVSFHEEPEAFYPTLVTPDVSSSDEEEAS
mmetsp:Transcript_17211/g.28591  ORF Transcript_17211/g.28591 Transcript_17211/m.28591 type:complete len:355 (+) Transcript_17211:391-1455(+)|eukprot:CAMPEP_0119011500 /NCGR_PEP_ID=MMETSP1176-20130426/5716_1 /TAXON_ID=265551 /ORGANISM="Synedropsis recta cf, Strain CCMP1620" /LENGTH=354 /DNA_ID=CAMNT_0006964343 /DNA_START=367 /DNA_END=1431 /DNA_ORIENTATION=+